MGADLLRGAGTKDQGKGNANGLLFSFNHGH